MSLEKGKLLLEKGKGSGWGRGNDEGVQVIAAAEVR